MMTLLLLCMKVLVASQPFQFCRFDTRAEYKMNTFFFIAETVVSGFVAVPLPTIYAHPLANSRIP